MSLMEHSVVDNAFTVTIRASGPMSAPKTWADTAPRSRRHIFNELRKSQEWIGEEITRRLQLAHLEAIDTYTGRSFAAIGHRVTASYPKITLEVGYINATEEGDTAIGRSVGGETGYLHPLMHGSIGPEYKTWPNITRLTSWMSAKGMLEGVTEKQALRRVFQMAVHIMAEGTRARGQDTIYKVLRPREERTGRTIEGAVVDRELAYYIHRDRIVMMNRLRRGMRRMSRKAKEFQFNLQLATRSEEHTSELQSQS